MANNVTDLGKVGITLKGEWNSSTSYERLDTVTYEGSLYIAVKDNVGSQPSESNTNWMLGAKHGEFTEQQLEDFKEEVVAESKEEMDDYTDDKKTELDTYTGTKKAELDTYEGTKEAELNTYASGLKDDFDSNATSKTNAFNTNATSKTNDFDSNAVAKTTAFDTNASTKTSAFDDNATAKTTAFDENAEEKTGDFNDNVDTKTTEFDAHVEEKETEFDENVDNIQEQITDIQEFIDSELEQGITEKGTRADVDDSAKWYGELAPEGRTEQKQLSGKNFLNVNENLTFTRYKEVTVNMPAGTYKVTYTSETHGGENKPGIRFSDNNIFATLNDKEKTFTLASNETKIYLYSNGTSYSSSDGIDATINQLMISIEGGDYEPYVGGTASPNPDYPQEIRNVEGRSCTNKFNPIYLSIEEGYNTYDEETGLWTTSAIGSYNRSIFQNKVGTDVIRDINKLPKLNISTYTIKLNDYTNDTGLTSGEINYALLNSNGEKIEGAIGNVSSQFTITTEQECYLDIRRRNNSGTFSFSSIQINEGSTALTYEPYFEGKRLEFNVCNKNLGNMEDLYKDMIAFNPNYVRKEVVDGKDCIVFKSDSYRKENGFCGLKGRYKTNIRYKLDCDARIYDTSPTTTKTLYINAYDSNGGRIGGTSSSTQDANWKHFSFVTNELSSLFNIAFSFSSPTEWCLANLSIVKYTGEEYKYVENKEQTILFPMATGQKLMEGDYLADDGVHHVRGQILLPAAKNLSTATIFGKRMQYAQYGINNMKLQISSNSNFKCNKVSYCQGVATKDEGYIISTNFIILTDIEDTINNMNQKFQGSILEYPLNKETIDPYTPAQAEAYNKLKKIMLNQGVNHIWTETDGLEPNLQLTYYKSNKERLNNIEARLELLEN